MDNRQHTSRNGDCPNHQQHQRDQQRRPSASVTVEETDKPEPGAFQTPTAWGGISRVDSFDFLILRAASKAPTFCKPSIFEIDIENRASPVVPGRVDRAVRLLVPLLA